MINTTKMLKRFVTATVALSLFASEGWSQQFYFDAACISAIELDEQCNVTLMKRSLQARYGRGTATLVKYENIQGWNYTDSSKLKMDVELAGRIGLIGLLFKKVVHRHVFSISYFDDFGDKQSLIINFKDSQYVNPMLAALRQRNNAQEVN